MSTGSEILEFPVVPQVERLSITLLKTVPVIVLGALLMASVIAVDRRPDEIGWVYFLSVLLILAAAIPVFIYQRQSQRPGVLRIEPDHVRWRDTMLGYETALAYADLWSVYKRGRGRNEHLVLQTAGKMQIAVPTASFAEPRVADEVLQAVHERIGQLADGQQRLDEMASRKAATVRVAASRPWASEVAAAVLGLVFLAEYASGALEDPLLLWAFGANSYPLVKHGELFRLATSNLLHANLLHLYFNVMALLSFGAFLEPLLGKGRLITILLLSALAGAAGSAFLGQHPLALGASTGIAGLIGVYVLVLWRWPRQLQTPPKKSTWLWIAFAFIWPAIILQNVDHMAHLTGFLAGFGIAFLECRTAELRELASQRRPLFRATAGVLAALFLIAGLTALKQAGDPVRPLEVASVLLEELTLPRGTLNNLAWKVAASPSASRAQLTNALHGAERAVEKEPGEPALRDTLATVQYRLGQWEQAVRTEYEIPPGDRSPFHVSQLARFEAALVKARGPLVLGMRPAGIPQPRVTPEGSIRIDLGDVRSWQGAILHFVLSSEGKPIVLFEVTVGAAESSNVLLHPLPSDLPRPDEAALALVDTRRQGALPGETQWQIQAIVPEVASLPDPTS